MIQTYFDEADRPYIIVKGQRWYYSAIIAWHQRRGQPLLASLVMEECAAAMMKHHGIAPAADRGVIFGEVPDLPDIDGKPAFPLQCYSFSG